MFECKLMRSHKQKTKVLLTSRQPGWLRVPAAATLLSRRAPYPLEGPPPTPVFLSPSAPLHAWPCLGCHNLLLLSTQAECSVGRDRNMQLVSIDD